MGVSEKYREDPDLMRIFLKRLHEGGCRVTKQRMVIVEVILKGGYETCKDIYYQVMRRDNSIGMATVYRTVRQLEELGLLKRIERLELNLEGLGSGHDKAGL